MKLLIVTRADDNIKYYTKFTIPIIEKFAKSWNADFKILSHEPPFLTDDGNKHYRLLKVYDLLKDYDRVLCLDSDIIIQPNCPNPFKIVPIDQIGTIYEDVGSRQSHRRNLIHQIQKHWPDIGWRQGYTNAGTFLLSNIHREIFLPVNSQYWTGWGSMDVQMGYNIVKHGYKIHRLSYKWNHMTMFSEPWMGNNKNRFDSYIIHYAGSGIHEGSAHNKITQMLNDYKKIYGSTNI